MEQLSPHNGNLSATMDCTALTDTHDLDDSIDSLPTPAQRSLSDSSQTSVKKLFVSEEQRIDVTQANVDELFESLTENNASLVTLQDLFNKYPKSEFISRVIVNASSSETKLEELRDMLFTEVRKLHEYPYPSSAELKRRVRRTGGDTVYKKYAGDIYQLVNVLDGGSFDEISNMLSIPKSQSRSEFNNSMCGSRSNPANADILSSTVSQIQADLIQIKQDNASLSAKLRDDISSLKSSVSKIQHETNVLFETLKSLIAENTQGIDRITCERSSGIAKLRSDIKVMQAEVDSNRESLDRHIGESREAVSSQSKTMDKRLNKLEQRLRSTCDGNLIYSGHKKPATESVSTQVHESDLGHTVPKCCDHNCKRSSFISVDKSPLNHGHSVTTVPGNIQSSPQITKDTYADRLMNRDPAYHQVGAKSLSPGDPLHYSLCEQNNDIIHEQFIPENGDTINSVQSQPLSVHDSTKVREVTRQITLTLTIEQNVANGQRHSQLHNDRTKPKRKGNTQYQSNLLIDTHKSLPQSEKQTPVSFNQQYPERNTASATHTDSVYRHIPTRITRTDAKCNRWFWS
jgi:hypothetical protein